VLCSLGKKTHEKVCLNQPHVPLLMSKSNNSTVTVFQMSTSVQQIKHVPVHLFVAYYCSRIYNTIQYKTCNVPYVTKMLFESKPRLTLFSLSSSLCL